MVTLTSYIGGTDLVPLKDPAYKDSYGEPLYDYINETQSELVTKTVDQNFADKVLSRANMKDTAEKAYSLGNISGAVAVDYTNGQYQYATVTGNITGITVSNWPASGNAGWLTLELTQDGTGSRTLALSSAYKTQGGDGITLTTTAGAKDKLRLETRDAGTTIDAFVNLDLK